MLRLPFALAVLLGLAFGGIEAHADRPPPLRPMQQIQKVWQRTGLISATRQLLAANARIRRLHRAGFAAAYRTRLASTMLPIRIFDDPDTAFASPKLQGLGELHRFAFDLMEDPAPILSLAQTIERHVLMHGLRTDQTFDNEQYEQAFTAELARELKPTGLKIVYLRDYENPYDPLTMRARFDNYELWVDVLAHGPGHHGRMTHALQIATVALGMLDHGYSQAHLQAWYQSMGTGAVSFGGDVFEATASRMARQLYRGNSYNRAPFNLAFERWQGPTAPVNLSTLLGEAMLHPYFTGLP